MIETESALQVLIAEDDPTSRTILTAVLEKWGYASVSVCDGREAWEAMQKPGAPRLAILDWNMPHLDGLEVCRRVRSLDDSNPPYIIILTARDEKADIVKGLEAGGNDYISKPYDNAELLARIRVGQRMIEMQSSLNEAKEKLEHQATHDPLTGVFNRRAILQTLKNEVSRVKRSSSGLSIGMCDIDHFKEVNDTHGHQVGDDVLCGFVQRVQSSLRDYDFVGRYGGEEFLVIAPTSKGSLDESLYHRLCTSVSESPIKTRNGNVSVTVSIGVAQGNEGNAVDTILAAADAALYRAKDEGRNRVVFG